MALNNKENYQDLIKRLWFINPLFFAIIYAALITVALLIPESFYRETLFVYKYVNLSGIAYSLTCIFIFALGAMLGIKSIKSLKIRYRRISRQAIMDLGYLGVVLASVGIAGSVLMLAKIVAGVGGIPSLLYLAMESTIFIRDAVETAEQGVRPLLPLVTPGCLLCLLSLSSGQIHSRRLSYLFRVIVCLALVVTLVRALVWSQRLAFLYLAVPLIILHYRLWAVSSLTKVQRKTRIVYPLAILALVVLVFFGGEFIRTYHISTVDKGYQQNAVLFLLGRFLGYYVGSVNNMFALFNQETLQHTFSAYSLGWFWTLPILGREYGLVDVYHRLLGGYEVAYSYKAWFEFAEQFNINPSFNVFTGFGYLYLDWGWWGLLGAFILGILSGWLFASFIIGNIGGLLVYPIWLVALAEIPRILFFGNHNFAIAVLPLAIIGFLMLRNGRLCL